MHLFFTKMRPSDMTLDIFFLVITSSFIHATWNYLAKSIKGGTSYIWLVSLITSILYFPIVSSYIIIYNIDFSTKQILFLSITAVNHLIYFLILQRAYLKSDFSVVYPIARGAGPLFSSLAAILFFGESLSLLGFFGLFLISAGIFTVSGLNALKGNVGLKRGLYYGIIIGFLIALYTLNDSYSVKILAISPFLIDYVSHPFRVITLSPLAYKNKHEIVDLWKNYKRKIIAIAILNPISFILVLYALKFSQITYVAPIREFSIVIGVFLAYKLLKEENFKQRLIGSILIICGIFVLLNG